MTGGTVKPTCPPEHTVWSAPTGSAFWSWRQLVAPGGRPGSLVLSPFSHLSRAVRSARACRPATPRRGAAASRARACGLAGSELAGRRPRLADPVSPGPALAAPAPRPGRASAAPGGARRTGGVRGRLPAPCRSRGMLAQDGRAEATAASQQAELPPHRFPRAPFRAAEGEPAWPGGAATRCSFATGLWLRPGAAGLPPPGGAQRPRSPPRGAQARARPG